MKKLSIIVPIFNVKKYLAECVNSLTSQYYSNCEIILVDDGSTDGSSILCDQLAVTDKRIRVVHKANEGLSSARNVGMDIANGQYLSFIDSDDYVAPNMFESLISKMEETDASVAICNFEVFNKVNNYRSKRYDNSLIEYSPQTQLNFYSAALDSSCNRVFKSDAIKIPGIFFEHKNIVAQEDYWFQVRLFSHIERIVTVRDCLYYYRERGSSITKSHSDGDITNRNLRFYTLVQEYVQKNTNRKIDIFLNYLLVNLLNASVNNASATSPKVIKEIISYFERTQDFSKAISAESINLIIKGDSIRDKYTRLTYWLLRNRLKFVFAVVEAMRLKRLRSNNRTDLYFE